MADKEFDPDAYNEEMGSKEFDPDAYNEEMGNATSGSDPIKLLPPGHGVSLSAGPTGAMHFARHLSFGLGDKIVAAEQALKDVMHDKTGHTTFSDAFKRNLEFNDALLSESDQAHPMARWTGNVLGVGGNLAAMAGAAPIRAALAARGMIPAAAETALPAVGTVAGLTRGAKEGLKLGALLGGVGGYAGGRSDSATGTLGDAALGGGLGALGGGFLGGLGGAALGRLATRTQPQVAGFSAPGLPALAQGITPTPEAQILMKHGIPLTLRQMNPEGPIAEISEASERVPILGHMVKEQEKVGLRSWLDAALKQAQPGEGPMIKGDVTDRLGDIQKQIRALYDHVADSKILIQATHPTTGEQTSVTTALKSILDDNSYQASDQDLRIVKNIFDDQLSKLYRATDPETRVGDNTARILMDVRSKFRDAAQDAMQQDGGFARAQMFHDAADSMTGGLRAGLAPSDLATLDRADAAYSNFSRLANAARKAAGQIGENEFSPRQLSTELAQAYGRKFVTDSEAGGTLRELARAGKSVFSPRSPQTGHGEHFKSTLGALLGPLILSANRSPAAQAAFTAAAQRAAEAGSQSVGPPAAGALEQALTGSLQRIPAGVIPATTLRELSQWLENSNQP